jgi:hypothetical protein
VNLSSRIKPISYLKAHVAEIVRGLGEKGEPLVITQIGSGAIESANKFICHDRLKKTGAWWYPTGANNVLKLRCAKYSGTFARVMELYRKRTCRRVLDRQCVE